MSAWSWLIFWKTDFKQNTHINGVEEAIMEEWPTHLQWSHLLQMSLSTMRPLFEEDEQTQWMIWALEASLSWAAFLLASDLSSWSLVTRFCGEAAEPNLSAMFFIFLIFYFFTSTILCISSKTPSPLSLISPSLSTRAERAFLSASFFTVTGDRHSLDLW